MKNELPVVVGVEIPLDEYGRYNMNTLHKSSGEGKHKSPNKWLENKHTQELIAELEAKLLKNIQTPNSGSVRKVINVVNGGSNPGTYAHELIAISYAGWIRPDFQLDVNQAFIDYRAGKVEINLLDMPSLDAVAGRINELRNQLVLDEKAEQELLTMCSLTMNARKKTKPKRQQMIEALAQAGQGSLAIDDND
ncbi:KilA-N domain-containing protein [Serratia liquefaciens]|uniref:KilA-N domain-containing protein n=1 Tax=Serratia liquefaciens TaxID=614 RepID=UPI00390623C0